MIYRLENLIEFIGSVSVEIDGEWVPCRPVPGPFTWRLKAAWEVLRGRADAFYWPKGQ